MKSNFTFKNIREFVPGDTLYAGVASDGGDRVVFLAEFISFDAGKVQAKLLASTVNPELYERMGRLGGIVSVRLSSCGVYGRPDGDEGYERYHWFDALGYAAYAEPDVRALRVPAKHPSYAMITISKTQGGGNRAFFGSPILQGNAVRIEVTEAELKRDLHEDRIFSKSQIIVLEMTSQQFADMLTSVNSGGVAATILRRDGQGVEGCPFVSKIEQFQTEFKDKIAALTANMTTIMRKASAVLTSPKAPSKAEREMLLRDFADIERELHANIPFVGTQFAEQMDRVVGEAKAAISAHIHDCARQHGLPEPRGVIALEDKQD